MKNIAIDVKQRLKIMDHNEGTLYSAVRVTKMIGIVCLP